MNTHLAAPAPERHTAIPLTPRTTTTPSGDCRTPKPASPSPAGTRRRRAIPPAPPLPPRALARATSITLTALLCATLALPVRAPSARASPSSTWRWPLDGQPRIIRRFFPPPEPWLAGHRGIDLAAPAATPVLAAGPGTIGFAGPVAGKGVVTIDHQDGLRTTYLPVTASVRRGQPITAGAELGVLESPADSKPHCAESCLHWGLLREGRYLNPLQLLGQAPTRLLPFWPSARPTARGADPLAPPRHGPHSAPPTGAPTVTEPRSTTLIPPQAGPAPQPPHAWHLHLTTTRNGPPRAPAPRHPPVSGSAPLPRPALHHPTPTSTSAAYASRTASTGPRFTPATAGPLGGPTTPTGRGGEPNHRRHHATKTTRHLQREGPPSLLAIVITGLGALLAALLLIATAYRTHRRRPTRPRPRNRPVGWHRKRRRHAAGPRRNGPPSRA
ncbi:M23 family metallopeptidase [Nonomuraea candida]|uniref:M23 family metallopeptidase n=1 Tax=Nonomuraea candida TaxID=359159 RepID=UPI000A0035E6